MEIQNPHDKFFKAVISQLGYAKELISIKLSKEMKTQLDWERLRQEPGSFIDEDYKEHFTDALFSIPYRNKEKEVLIGILVEHKSHPDPKVFSQLLRYQSNIYASLSKMPILIQLFYHGQKKWDLPLSFFESLNLDDEDKELFRGNVLDFQYQLVDLSSEEYTHLKLSLELRSILYVLKNIWRLHEAEYIRSFFHEFLSELRVLDNELWKKIVAYWLGFVNVQSEELLKHIPKEEEHIMKSTMTQLLEKGMERGMAEGIEKGMEKGMEKGKAEGIEEGMERGKAEVAKAMLAEGDPASKIAKVTGLSEKEIDELKT